MSSLPSPDLAFKREIGNLAIWTLSSCKPGNGIQQLRESLADTYWQSDGPQPHLVSVQFHKKVTIQEIGIYTTFKADESYTPSKISVRVGTTYQDLQEVRVVELREPEGWIYIPLYSPGGTRPLRTWFVQIAVLENHQHGKDTHIRQMAIFSPREANVQEPIRPAPLSLDFDMFPIMR